MGEFPIHRLLLVCGWPRIPGSQGYPSRLVFIHGSLYNFVAIGKLVAAKLPLEQLQLLNSAPKYIFKVHFHFDILRQLRLTWNLLY